MIIIHFRFKKPGIEKSNLFGKKENPPVITINLGFISIIRVDDEGSLILRAAMEGLLTDSNWLLDNHPEIQKRIKEGIKNKQNEELERYKGYYENLLESKADLANKLTERNTEVWHLKEAIRIVKERSNELSK